MKNLLVSAVALVAFTTLANASDCDAPPYGDTMDQYNRFVTYNQEHDLISGPQKLFRTTCLARAHAGKERDILLLTIPAEEIAETGTIRLAVEYYGLAAIVLGKMEVARSASTLVDDLQNHE